MAFDENWDSRPLRPSAFENAGGGVLRVALLFGSAAVALSLIAAPLIESSLHSVYAENDSDVFGVDTQSTGSIGYKGTYTIRRSVRQSSPDAICILRDNGVRSGDC